MNFSPLVVAALLLTTPAHADSGDAIAQVEARFGYGATLGGQSGDTVVRATPLGLNLRASFAIRDAPRVFGFAGLAAEVGDRTSAGLDVGATLELSPILRASAGARGLLMPYMLFGPSGAFGACFDVGATLCGDLELTFYVLGDDLPSGTVATQVQGVFSVRFDAI